MLVQEHSFLASDEMMVTCGSDRHLLIIPSDLSVSAPTGAQFIFTFRGKHAQAAEDLVSKYCMDAIPETYTLYLVIVKKFYFTNVLKFMIHFKNTLVCRNY